MYHFCTYFNQYYLSRGLALYHSLAKHVASFELWVLCLDQTTADVLNTLNLPNIRTVLLTELEAYDTQLLAVKPTRSQIEYYFTLSPAWPLYLLEKYPHIDIITYLDSDLFFYADAAPLYAELATNSILIIPHRFPAKIRDREVYGLYNVGLLMFRNDERGQSCLRWWRERCLEWCYDRLEDERFADQKYLNRWPDLFEGVTISQHVGANLAPWNFPNYHIITGSDNKATVDGQPLLFYHFQALRLINWWLYKPNVILYSTPMPGPLQHWLYDPYVQTLKHMYRLAQRTQLPIIDPFQHARGIEKDRRTWRQTLHELRIGKIAIHLGR
jgi:hypothetical protein